MSTATFLFEARTFEARTFEVSPEVMHGVGAPRPPALGQRRRPRGPAPGRSPASGRSAGSRGNGPEAAERVEHPRVSGQERVGVGQGAHPDVGRGPWPD